MEVIAQIVSCIYTKYRKSHSLNYPTNFLFDQILLLVLRMKNLWQHVREFVPMAAVIVLCLVIVPSAQASTGNNGSNTTTTATQQTQTTAAAATDGTKPQKAKPEATTRPASKSVLDDEVLDSPISYFREAFSSEKEDTDAAPSSDAVTMTVKALVATLLSTIL